MAERQIKHREKPPFVFCVIEKCSLAWTTRGDQSDISVQSKLILLNILPSLFFYDIINEYAYRHALLRLFVWIEIKTKISVKSVKLEQDSVALQTYSI